MAAGVAPKVGAGADDVAFPKRELAVEGAKGVDVAAGVVLKRGNEGAEEVEEDREGEVAGAGMAGVRGKREGVEPEEVREGVEEVREEDEEREEGAKVVKRGDWAGAGVMVEERMEDGTNPEVEEGIVEGMEEVVDGGGIPKRLKGAGLVVVVVVVVEEEEGGKDVGVGAITVVVVVVEAAGAEEGAVKVMAGAGVDSVLDDVSLFSSVAFAKGFEVMGALKVGAAESVPNKLGVGPSLGASVDDDVASADDDDVEALDAPNPLIVPDPKLGEVDAVKEGEVDPNVVGVLPNPEVILKGKAVDVEAVAAKSKEGRGAAVEASDFLVGDSVLVEEVVASVFAAEVVGSGLEKIREGAWVSVFVAAVSSAFRFGGEEVFSDVAEVPKVAEVLNKAGVAEGKEGEFVKGELIGSKDPKAVDAVIADEEDDDDVAADVDDVINSNVSGDLTAGGASSVFVPNNWNFGGSETTSLASFVSFLSVS